MALGFTVLLVVLVTLCVVGGIGVLIDRAADGQAGEVIPRDAETSRKVEIRGGERAST